MSENNERINELFEKLELVLKKQDAFSEQVKALRAEIEQLKQTNQGGSVSPIKQKPIQQKPPPAVIRKEEPVRPTNLIKSRKPVVRKQPEPFFKMPDLSVDFEKFIGENLINKVGIIITIIGVAIGAKYSIENNLISPRTRIVLGYLTGLGLLGFGIKLKKDYASYSAVLVSGAMAIMYFITYAAYSFYGLFPQVVAFGLMVIFTIFTVLASLNYNRQVIALIGLVGAYAVPFLLSSGSGQVGVLYSYIAIINIGILFIAFKKYWKPLYYISFALTWLMYGSWCLFEYDHETHFTLALTFLFIFFLTFYLVFLGFKLIQKKKFVRSDIALLLANSFIFYSLGYFILNEHPKYDQLLGLFTLLNGVLHFIVSSILYRQKLADRNLFYMVTGLVLVFITMAIPVQLDGNWVTLLWAGEAALLFWIGRSKSIPFYEQLAYPLMLLALFSLFDDWESMYRAANAYSSDLPASKIRPLFNIHFLTAVLFLAAFGFINYFHFTKPTQVFSGWKKEFSKIMSFIIPAIFIGVLYQTFKIEIEVYWDQLFRDSITTYIPEGGNANRKSYNYNLHHFRDIWVINYTLFFLTILSFINIKKFKHGQLGLFNLVLNVFTILAFLAQGLYLISELRESYLDQAANQFYETGISYIAIRYISFAFIVALLVATYQYCRSSFIKMDLKMPFEILMHISILWIISSELLHWMDFADSSQSYKLGLSILWGVYALALVVIGIWQRKKYLRIAAIILFALTLIKLFVYDISHLNTIAKTIVFVSLGILLLIISFLYNKYVDRIENTATNIDTTTAEGSEETDV